MKKNLIITFLGPDGSGKSTSINYLIEYFKKKKKYIINIYICDQGYLNMERNP